MIPLSDNESPSTMPDFCCMSAIKFKQSVIFDYNSNICVLFIS